MPTQLPHLPLNQILYGPPGTGKTFNSVRKAVEIIDGTAAEDNAKCKQRFDALRALGQIEFVTFHQSFSYEEFIEGLRPVLNEDDDGTARYEIRNGVLKKLSLDAADEVVRYFGGFERIWQHVVELVDQGQTTQIGEQSQFTYEVSMKKGSIGGRRSDGTELFCTKRQAKDVWNHTLHTRYISLQDVQQCLGKDVPSEDLIVDIINEMSLEIFERPTEAVQKYLTGDPNFKIDATKSSRYVLIIDEINRGNISKILGELITLLEEDKRLGADNELRVK